MDHSCEPNAFWELDEKNTMVFKTTKEINGGFDAIRISYLTGSNLRLSKKERNVMLRDQKPWMNSIDPPKLAMLPLQMQ